jgi:transcription elongation factor Elf1
MRATVFTGCFECDNEAEFKGLVDKQDVAHFPCGACGKTFTISNWADFFDEEEEEVSK